MTDRDGRGYIERSDRAVHRAASYSDTMSSRVRS
jgi:hypothetical protein